MTSFTLATSPESSSISGKGYAVVKRAASLPRYAARPFAWAVAAAAAVGLYASAGAAESFIDASKHVPSDGSADASAGIQRLIEANPNRTIYFPDGTYLLSHPVATPADPTKSVDLRLSNFAVFKAAEGWTNTEAMVRLGGIFPANDIRKPGSVYSLTGGIIDGSGVAAGVSIDSGRETKVRDVSMKNVTVGLRVKKGANSGSSDCDIADVNIVGSMAAGSIGVLVEGADNTFSNMRIAGVQTGVRLRSGGNLLTNIHPLYTFPKGVKYEESAGFDDVTGDNSYRSCYSDQFSTGFRFGAKAYVSVMDSCIAYWYASLKGRRHVGIGCAGRFRAHVRDMRFGFRAPAEGAVQVAVAVAEDGGDGFLHDCMINEASVTDQQKKHRRYIR